ncbi:MAG: sigma-70 family RNA polymerase sigma factor [Planctomycetota bacterium]
MAKAANLKIEDSVLVERCRQGDSAAMERLILKYQNRIYNVILRMCRNTDDAAELTQETFVKIIKKIGEFEGRSNFYTWAFRIAVNLTLNFRQRSSRLNLKSLEIEDVDRSRQTRRQLKDLLTDDSCPDPATMVQNKELCDIVMQSLMQLDEAHRAVVVLRDIEGMNYARIAEVLDIELGTVKSRLSRARSNLRKIMEAILQ